ncbi:uncharacterized protein LOC130670886 [Microplitis mediator]|uniref:uncharacterized protein LOC130670886 n=1 Tax=Microplitis mediator TaxID=375433 RepID=UPI0025574B52|nr:uncharacterized protein LOC130670886 [Microplitis mediator]
MGPLGAGQRRPSRSPRSQRSRSADVDRLRKYAERIGERRNTEGADSSKLNPSRWLPRSRSSSRSPSAERKSQAEKLSPAANDKLDPAWPEPASPKKLSPNVECRRMPSFEEETRVIKTTCRSMSSDVDSRDRRIDRRNTEVGHEKILSFRWVPIPKISDPSDPPKIANRLAKNAASKWMTFAKYQLPSSLPRQSLSVERKASMQLQETPKWPVRKFHSENSKSENENEFLNELPKKLDPIDKIARISQRIRELYDFKTENEWPKRASDASNAYTWISNSSEDDKHDKHTEVVRRNSQDLEFNDRTTRPKIRRQNCENEILDEDNSDVKMKRLHERLRFSEDFTPEHKPIAPERRTVSDDHETRNRHSWHVEKSTIGNLSSNINTVSSNNNCSKKRDSDVSVSTKSRSSRSSYAEVISKRTSDASYVSIGKCPSVETKSSEKIIELPPRRAMSQGEERPATPVPPNDEINDDLPSKLMMLRSKRKSTRYKVYLT